MDETNAVQPKRRGRPPKRRPIVPVKLPDGVVRAEDVPDKCEGIKHVFEDENDEGAICRCGKTRCTTETDGESTWKRAVPIDAASILPTISVSDDVALSTIHAQIALITLHLKRVGAEITDGGGTVHIPAPAILPEGARVVVHIYREG